MIFDEVDRGVGGAVASAIGERLARLGRAIAGPRRHPLAPGRRPRVAPLSDREDARASTAPAPASASSRTRSGARRSRACSPALRSPTKRAPRRRGCWTRHDRLCRAAACGECRRPSAQNARPQAHSFDEIGLESPRTFIASGNLLFRSKKREAAVKRELEDALGAHMGKPVDVMIRSAEELVEAASANPFAKEPGDRVVAIFFDEAPADEAIDVGEKCRRRTAGARQARNLCPFSERAGSLEAQAGSKDARHRAQHEYGREAGRACKGVGMSKERAVRPRVRRREPRERLSSAAATARRGRR